MVVLNLQLDADEAFAGMQDLLDRLENTAPLLAVVGDYFVGVAIPRNFTTETSPDGVPWARLRPLTIARREAAGHTPIQILRGNSGTEQNLKASIHYEVSSNGVRIGSPLPHAGTHQYGAAQGAYGRTKRNGPIPWATIPARPFLGIGEEDRRAVIGIVTDYLEG